MPRSRKRLTRAEITRKAGSVSTPKKRRVARANGRLGGRPGKFAVGAIAIANDKAPGDYRGRRGEVFEVGPGRHEYGVRFPDEPTTGHLMSWWLDRP